MLLLAAYMHQRFLDITIPSTVVFSLPKWNSNNYREGLHLGRLRWYSIRCTYESTRKSYHHMTQPKVSY
jgi:hypothetical protein